MVTLTQKEQSLLQDAKKHEELCIEKYNKHANSACDPQLKGLFEQLKQKEEQHLESINQIIGGIVPTVNSQQQSSKQPAQYNQPVLDQNSKQADSYLCQDALTTEKQVSSMYDTAIFEFKDPNIREVLNHIQKEEQEHGEEIYNYMAQNQMYN